MDSRMPGTDRRCIVSWMAAQSSADTKTAAALPARRVFITENETNFLAFPPAARRHRRLRRWLRLGSAGARPWLHRCQLHYWGDIDTHGFAILDQLRGYFPGAASFLMDRETLLAHRLHWGEEPDPARHDLSRLTTRGGGGL
jgi:hypothetical protein